MKRRRELKTPVWGDLEDVYEPREDTFLLMDALEQDLSEIVDRSPRLGLEVGCGSGVVVTSLAEALGSSCHWLAVDINPKACRATLHTATLNSVQERVSVICGDLTTSLHLTNSIDLLVFNPPYVVTDPEEIQGGLERSWAGGVCGTQVLNRLIPQVHHFLSDKGAGYIVAIEDNNPTSIIALFKKHHILARIIAEKKIPGEKLYIIKITKMYL